MSNREQSLTCPGYGVVGHTQPGQNVYAVGSIADLGGWIPERAALLSAVAHPVWQGSEVVWQPGPNNLYPGSGSVTRGSF